jgi:hypothetical protein
MFTQEQKDEILGLFPELNEANILALFAPILDKRYQRTSPTTGGTTSTPVVTTPVTTTPTTTPTTTTTPVTVVVSTPVVAAPTLVDYAPKTLVNSTVVAGTVTPTDQAKQSFYTLGPTLAIGAEGLVVMESPSLRTSAAILLNSVGYVPGNKSWGNKVGVYKWYDTLSTVVSSVDANTKAPVPAKTLMWLRITPTTIFFETGPATGRTTIAQTQRPSGVLQLQTYGYSGEVATHIQTLGFND